MKNNKDKGLSNLELITGAIGVSPIPVLGEICGTAFIYKIIKGTPLGEETLPAIEISAVTTGLLRLALYTLFYAPIYKKVAEYLQ